MLNFAKKIRQIVYFAQKWGGWSLPSLPASAGPVFMMKSLIGQNLSVLIIFQTRQIMKGNNDH